MRFILQFAVLNLQFALVWFRPLAAALLWGAALGAWPAVAAEWPDSRVAGPVICRADFSLVRVEPVLRDLAQLQSDLGAMLGLTAPGERIEIYLFHDRVTYARYLERYLPNVPYRRALYVKSRGPGKVLAYLSRDFEVDLRHECTHALLHASLPWVPLWLDEGLAQYFEVARSERAYGHPNLVGIRASLRWDPPPPLADLEKKANLADMGRTEYRIAWAWVHFMIHGPPEAHKALVEYLGELRSGGEPGLLSVRLQQRLPEPEQRLAEHLRSWNRRIGSPDPQDHRSDSFSGRLPTIRE
jgi:hypothetical protein